MIAKNAIILIIQIETDRAEGKNVWDAVVAAASSRLRPMLLTAVSTVLGMIPIAPTVFWGPMAFAIMGGLMVATLLTLVFLPTLYVAVFDRKPAKAAAAGRADVAAPAAIRFGLFLLLVAGGRRGRAHRRFRSARRRPAWPPGPACA